MAISRREFIDFLNAACAGVILTQTGAARGKVDGATPVGNGAPIYVNDIHSQLNATRVTTVVRPNCEQDLRSIVREARRKNGSVSIAGGRHAMGGQQFGTDTTLIDMRGMNHVFGLDQERGLIEVEAGIEWPQLLDYVWRTQQGRSHQWGIMQKQTGADRLSLGGALASNVHGRGLKLKPIIDQVESFTMIDFKGQLVRCSRSENRELFRLAIGGYGLFGILNSITLRLWERKKVERVVVIGETTNIIDRFNDRIADGFLYGDYQFATASDRDSFLRRGVFSCYRPVDLSTPLTQSPTRFHPKDWERLTYYSHTHKKRAFDVYSRRYLATSGQIYWADSQLSAAYVDYYHDTLDRRMKVKVKATEMITEIYVPRASLASFMEDARVTLREQQANIIYGTVRLIEKDDESFLCWAKESYACVIFNLHVTHDKSGVERAAGSFRSLIDLGLRYGGSYYLTYHRFATRAQVEACYPQMSEFLRLKLEYDPHEVFQSDWYRHYKAMFTAEAGVA